MKKYKLPPESPAMKDDREEIRAAIDAGIPTETFTDDPQEALLAALASREVPESLVDPEPTRPDLPPPSLPATVNISLGPVKRFHGEWMLEMPVLVPHTARIALTPVNPESTMTLQAVAFGGGKILVRWEDPNMASGICVATLQVDA